MGQRPREKMADLMRPRGKMANATEPRGEARWLTGWSPRGKMADKKEAQRQYG